MLSFKKVKIDWIVYRKGGTKAQHTHFKTKTMCIFFINAIKNGIMPGSERLQISAQRVLTRKEFELLK